MMTATSPLAVEFIGWSSAGTIVLISAVVAALMITIWNWRLIIRVERIEDDREQLHAQIGGCVVAMNNHETKDEERFKEIGKTLDEVQKSVTETATDMKHVSGFIRDGLPREIAKIETRISEHYTRNTVHVAALEKEISRLNAETAASKALLDKALPSKAKRKRAAKKATPK